MVKILINSNSRYPADRKRIKKVVTEILGENGLGKMIEVSICFVGDRKMKQLNAQYRSLPETTDVLSFSLKGTKFPDNILRLGDIIISYPRAREQAIENNLTVDEEIDNLIKHGLLSLLGLHNDWGNC